jgi:hypothetical protein
MYPEAQLSKGANPDKDGDEKRLKFKKIKANKELEAGKNKWQEFNSKSKFGKTQKKESMFRTPEGVNGRGKFQPHSSILPRIDADVTAQQSASPALAKPCARTRRAVGMSIRQMMTWTNTFP